MIAEIIPKIAGQFDNSESKYYARPSLAGPERCIRQMVYWGLGIERQPLPGRTILVFDDSSWHEELTADWIRKSAFRLHSEQMEVTITHPDFKESRKGRIDGVLTDIMGNDFLLEHKALNHFTFQRFWEGNELPLDYFCQCADYMRGLQAVNPDITRGILLIKNKNTSAYIEYLFAYEFDKLTILEMTSSTGEKKDDVHRIIEAPVGSSFRKFAAVQDYINRKALPKRQYFIDEWRCQYCGWAGTCWEGYEKEFQELKTDAMLPNEVADMVRYYKELGGQKSEIEKEYKSLSEKIKGVMKEVDAREARAGEYVCKVSLIGAERLDKTLLSPLEIEKATVKSFYEKLSISAPKKTSKKKEAA